MKVKIKEMRKRAGKTQKELAAELGVEWRTYGAWERGENTINVEQLCNICDALGCTPNDIMGWDDSHANGDPEEQSLLELYRSSSPANKRILAGVSDLLAGLEDSK